MKKFLRFVAEIKTWGCLSFTGTVCIYSFIDFVMGGEYMRYTLIWQMLAMCGIITLLQYIFFSGQVMKKTGYFPRLCIFCVLILGVCSGFAWVFRWFPLENPGAWFSFVIVFFVAFVVLCLGFELYFRILGRKYDAALGRSQKRPNHEEKVNKT